ncbi:RagB/SusD family nutrient uptake outer membrane protein [Pontibacter diazotrophicus]|uniref:RagB/SusD family nutrient uptake outer membrane protein n=1 Tax=Pontibacter diazotrophicus TaxID=1400979 RepID=A0A3D8LDH9_9BACT|nr:RagB/SusD family nutrient uptake outer membrane protein [Pontibacter diazotrophicus]RDV15403.1 RagB/SusD family nutrient uptake outer membrane protein [Pontibacter diazotrophicus]
MIRIHKIKSLSLSFIAVLALSTGCNDDFLNTQPLTAIPSEVVWTDAALADAFVTDLYTVVGQGGFDEQMQASLTDEAVFTHPGRGINIITEARSNPADPGFINYTLNWADMYRRIRAANLAIENLQEPQFDNPEMAERLLGEALFMRAYMYHQLLRYYGGVPLVDRAYELGEEDYSIARNTFAETVEFIVNDADQAAQLLEGESMAEGRGSRAAALALKSRVLLYAASDLHDIPTASARSSVIASYPEPELIGYVDGDQMQRWQRAQAAAKDVLDLPGYGFMMNLTGPVSPEEGTQNYIDMSLFRGNAENEMIFGRYFIQSKNENGGRVGLFNGPNGYRNWAGNTPLQDLVDDYEMMDGTEFSWDNPEHAAAPYENRDPRFEATILHDASDWKPRFTTTADPADQIQTGQYEIIADGEKTTHFGFDTRQSSIEDWNGTRTGYYMRRFVDPNPNLVDMNMWQQVPWAFFRYTEAVLNYVEASIELGQDAEAQEWLNKIRFRVGMPAVTETGEALMERYRNERRIEMAYEEQRYHDVRRWMIAEEEFGQQPRIIDIIGTLKPGKTVTTYQYDPENYNYTYNVIELGEGVENRAWDDKMYYLPIHRDEMNRNEQLTQNPGY